MERVLTALGTQRGVIIFFVGFYFFFIFLYNPHSTMYEVAIHLLSPFTTITSNLVYRKPSAPLHPSRVLISQQ